MAVVDFYGFKETRNKNITPEQYSKMLQETIYSEDTSIRDAVRNQIIINKMEAVKI